MKEVYFPQTDEDLIDLSKKYYCPIPSSTMRYYIMVSSPHKNRGEQYADMHKRRIFASVNDPQALSGLIFCSRHRSETRARQQLRLWQSRQNRMARLDPSYQRRSFFLFLLDPVRNLRSIIAAAD